MVLLDFDNIIKIEKAIKASGKTLIRVKIYSNFARGKIFTASIGSVDSLYPSVYYNNIYVCVLHQSSSISALPEHPLLVMSQWRSW